MNDSTSDTIKADTARLPPRRREPRLPTIAAMWRSVTERAGRDGEAGQGAAGVAGGMPDEVGRRHDCWPPSPSWNAPNAIGEASADI
jgi:hypothetical protein